MTNVIYVHMNEFGTTTLLKSNIMQIESSLYICNRPYYIIGCGVHLVHLLRVNKSVRKKNCGFTTVSSKYL